MNINSWIDLLLGLFFMLMAGIFIFDQSYHPWSWIAPFAAAMSFRNKIILDDLEASYNDSTK